MKALLRRYVSSLLLLSFTFGGDLLAKPSSLKHGNIYPFYLGLSHNPHHSQVAIPFKLEFQLLDSSLTPIADSEFTVNSLLIHQGKDVTLQFPLFNFQTAGTGSILQSTNALPARLRPREAQLFYCSNNDAYLQYVDLTRPYPTPISSFDLNINQAGQLQISANSSAIIAGGHSFNSQAVQYTTKNSKKKPRTKSLSQVFNLQMCDYQHFPQSSLTFPITIDVQTRGDLITVNVPAISFETTGEKSPYNKNSQPLIYGGYVDTSSGALSEKLRPTLIQTVYDSSSGLNLSIDTYGNLGIASANDITGVIPTGSYTTAPVTIMYHRPARKKIKIKNFIIQPAFTNFSKFTGSNLNNGIRDSHVNDISKDTVAWSWTDNSAQTDQTNGTLDCYVAVGKAKDGKVVARAPVRLTTMPVGDIAWDSAVAINRTNPNNIVVSFGRIGNTSTLMVCVTTDGGTTWSSPINIDPSVSNFGDARGVIADKYGNFWFSTTSETDGTNLVFYTSSDGGNTWSVVCRTTDSTSNSGSYDYPQIAVGNDGNGNYGLWFLGDFLTTDNNYIGHLGFIPTTGLGQFGTGSYISLDQFPNTVSQTSLTTSQEGSVYINSAIGDYDFINNFYVNSLVVKSPGSLDLSLVNNVQSILNSYQDITGSASYPQFYYSYYITTVNNTFYYDRKKALCIVYCERPSIASQDYYLYMVASFDEGVTWSKRIEIASSHNFNRGFSSVAFDNSVGSLSIGWYDSRNSPDSTGEQYFGAYINRKQLERILKELKCNSL